MLNTTEKGIQMKMFKIVASLLFGAMLLTGCPGEDAAKSGSKTGSAKSDSAKSESMKSGSDAKSESKS